MAEPENSEKKVDPTPIPEAKTADPSEEMIGGKKFSELDPETQKAVKELREEAKAKRLKLEETEKRLAAIEADKLKQEQEAKAAQEKALQEQGDYKKLYEAATPQLEELKATKAKVKELESYIDQALEARIKAIPENKRSIVDALPPMGALAKLKWLESNASLLVAPVAPNLDPGSSATNTGNVPDPTALARMYEDYRKQL